MVRTKEIDLKHIKITIHAKPIIKDMFWVLTAEDKRVGEINKQGSTYSLKIGDSVFNYKNLNRIKANANIEFEKQITAKEREVNQVHGYSTDAEPYNGVWSLQQKVPIFTKEENSKSWFAAGWYLVKQNKIWRQDFCPKLITLQRYDYRGPYKCQKDLLKVKA
jgi:ABC-type antimicrobial peptide transport system permease subunit